MNYIDILLNNPDYFYDFVKRYTYKYVVKESEDSLDVNPSSREVNEYNNNCKVLTLLLKRAKLKEKLSKNFLVQLNQLINENIVEVKGYRELPVHIVDSEKVLPLPNEIDSYMKEFMTFYNDLLVKDKVTLLDVAAMHIKYELIHPFIDGNGRLGRFLMLYLLFIKNKCPFIIPYSSRKEYLAIMESQDEIMLAAFLTSFQRQEMERLKTFTVNEYCNYSLK